jgi:hypothetical protein
MALATGDYRTACALMSPEYARSTQTDAAAFGSPSALDGPADCPRDLHFLATVGAKSAPALRPLTRPVQIKKIDTFDRNGMRCARVTVSCVSGGCQSSFPIQMCDMAGWKLTGPA